MLTVVIPFTPKNTASEQIWHSKVKTNVEYTRILGLSRKPYKDDMPGNIPVGTAAATNASSFPCTSPEGADSGVPVILAPPVSASILLLDLSPVKARRSTAELADCTELGWTLV